MSAQIMELAEKAARCAVVRLGRPRTLRDEDFEDMRQEAALAIWRVLDRGEYGESYAFVSGRRAAVLCWIRILCGRNPVAEELDESWMSAEGPAVEERPEGLPDELIEQLVGIFLQARAKRGERGLRAATRDAQIVALLCEGYSNEGITRELGIPRSHVKAYRQKIRRILSEYLQGR